MPILTRDDLERAGLKTSGGHSTSKDRNDSMGFNAPPPDVRRDIRREIWQIVDAANGGWVTRTDIYKALKLKKTPWINKHVERLVDEGYLQVYRGAWVNGFPMFWYRVPRDGE